MNPFEFKKAWKKGEQNLQAISLHTLSRLDLNAEANDFFSISGLPEDAAPFLTFIGDGNPQDKYSSINFLTDWFNFLEPEYKKYVAIGSDGSGDVIAINTVNNCIVEWLDHEDYFSARFMNTSVSQLANCLLCYRDFVKAMNAGKSIDECFETEFSEEQFEALHGILQSIDSKVVQEGFWREELEMLLANREDSRRKN